MFFVSMISHCLESYPESDGRVTFDLLCYVYVFEVVLVFWAD